jgi:hypothetical protein
MGTIFGGARWIALACALAVTSCITTENSLSRNDINSLKLAGVAVGFAPDSVVQWEDGVRAYGAAKSIPEDQLAAVVNTPECKAYVRGLLGPQIKAGMERALAGQFNGTRPVRLDITVASVTMPSAVQRILIGGNRGMVADARLVDARTGAVILDHPRLSTQNPTGQGIGGTLIQAAIDNGSQQAPIDKVLDSYAATYRDWLLRGT